MPKVQRGLPEWMVYIASSIFIVVLAVSAIWQENIRWLHFFQAWMYLAAILGAYYRNRWGLFIGISAAGMWAYVNLFITSFFFNGLHWMTEWARTGKLQHVDQMIAVPAWAMNVLVVIGCVWIFAKLPDRSWRDFARFAVTFALTTGFFVLDMYLFQPRYLDIFARLLHPHLPW